VIIFSRTISVRMFRALMVVLRSSLKEVPDAHRFGVAELVASRVIGIAEKPEVHKSNYTVTGLYMYDSKVFKVIRTLEPSGRGELEITDVYNYYIDQGRMGYRVLDGCLLRCGNV
jgi:glucose-1-phosphate thymidylyltransferase